MIGMNVCRFAGVTRLSNNLEEMTGKRANIFFRICWQVVAPVLVTVSQQVTCFIVNQIKNATLGKIFIFQNATKIVVVLLQVILVFSVKEFKPASYEDYVFPSWAQGVGWVIALASIIWIPVCAVHTLWVLPGSILQVTTVRYLPHLPSKT